ncbi:MAG: ATP-binding cassette domain-containing protein [Rhodospirillales bacterium]|nr:ATP-binding cassette domain-containing protein [Rhodospirillales bacterium]
MTHSRPASGTLFLLRRTIGVHLRPYFRQLGLAMGLMGVAAAMTAALAKLIQPTLDDVLFGGREDLVVPVAASFFGVFFLRGIATYGHTILMHRIGQSVVADIQKDLFEHFMTLDLRFFHAHPSGQLISRITNDVTVMRIAVSDALTGIGKNLLTLVLLVAVMFFQDWRLSLAAFAIFPFAAVFVARLGRRLRKVSRGIQDQTGNVSGLLSQVFQGMRLVKAYGMEPYEIRRVGAEIENLRTLLFKSVRVSNLSTPVNEFLVGVVLCGIILYGGHEAVAGRMTGGTLISFLAAFTLAYEPMKKLASLNNSLQTGLGAAERVFALLDTRGEEYDAPGASVLSVHAPEVAFDGVFFQYEKEDARQALENVSFMAPAGKVTALVGPSGSGKTTILNLIPRLYDATEGLILINGIDIRSVTRASLRSHIALVSQDVTIFDDTVYENIAYGKVGASQDEVYAAARAAAAEDFILEMPKGYQTLVGEDGVKLSGGQKQRIAIARAFLRDAPILLLDEATSALDTESERAIQASLAEIKKGRTTIVIAHRLSTVQDADKILVLDSGKIVECGVHETLARAGGLYARLYGENLRA